MPEKMPLIPAILPLHAISSTAASPIMTPPIVADSGVKLSNARFMVPPTFYVFVNCIINYHSAIATG
jgi:hypothetical protein